MDIPSESRCLLCLVMYLYCPDVYLGESCGQGHTREEFDREQSRLEKEYTHTCGVKHEESQAI